MRIFITGCLIALGGLFFTCSSIEQPPGIETIDNIYFEGRWTKTEKGQWAAAFSGASFEFTTTSKSAKVLMQTVNASDNPSESNFFNVFVNGHKLDSFEVNGNWTVYEGAKDTNHFQFVKRTEAFCGTVVLKAIECSHPLLPIAPKKHVKIEFIGNSLTCGYGNVVSIPAPPEGNPSTGFHSIHEDFSTSWAGRIIDSLNAHYAIVAWSGKGILRNYDCSSEQTMKEIYTQVLPGVPYDFQFQPDIIIVNLGANDFGCETSQDIPLIYKDFVNAYDTLIAIIRHQHPLTPILLTRGGYLSDSYPKNKNQLSHHLSAVQEVVKLQYQRGDRLVFTAEFDPISSPYGENWHPSRADHLKMANKMIPEIQKILSQ